MCYSTETNDRLDDCRKVCKKCARDLTLTPSQQWHCKPCEALYQKERRKDPALREMQESSAMKYRESHREEIKSYMKTYYRTVRKQNKESDGNRMSYKGQSYRLQRKRTGVCNLCRAVAKIDCKFTNFHHVLYDDSHPEAGIIELCRTCHNIESMNLGHIRRDKRTGRFV